MLVDAYSAARSGDFSLVHELHQVHLRPLPITCIYPPSTLGNASGVNCLCLLQVFCHPYDEQPEFHDKYYKPAAAAIAGNGGVAFMT